MSDRIGTTEARPEGFYWVILGQNPPQIAYWDGGWWRASDSKPWPPEAVTVASDEAPRVPFTTVQLDYQVTQDLVKMHTDIRFRLLAILPPIVAASVALVSAQTVGLSPFSMFSVGLMGFFLTLGLVLYDLRNSDLYNACVHRAKVLEGVMEFVRFGNEKIAPSRSLETALLRGAAIIAKEPNKHTEVGPKEVLWPGGAHRQRAVRYLKFLRRFPVSHGSALALVYGVLLGAWVFPIAKGLLVGAGYLLRIHYGIGTTSVLALVAAAAAAYCFQHSLSMADVPGAVHGLYPEPPDKEKQQQEAFEAGAKAYAASLYEKKAKGHWVMLTTDDQPQSYRGQARG
jgi:hypothetical protein